MGARLAATRVPKANSTDRTQLTARFVSCKILYRALLALIVAGFTILTEATAGSQSIGSSPECPSKTRPIYQFPFLRYDEDWSFLSCSQQTDQWDRLVVPLRSLRHPMSFRAQLLNRGSICCHSPLRKGRGRPFRCIFSNERFFKSPMPIDI